MRSHAELGDMERKVEAACQQSVTQVNIDGIPLSAAVEQVMSKCVREQLLSRYEQFPLHIQHNAAAKLWLMHGGSFLRDTSKDEDVQKALKRAADIGYAVRGNAGFSRNEDLWRIAGFSVRCAQNALAQIWNGPGFSTFASPSEAKEAFANLTQGYSLCWWNDSPHPTRTEATVMDILARSVWSNTGMNG
jgi:hypothetical protein